MAIMREDFELSPISYELSAMSFNTLSSFYLEHLFMTHNQLPITFALSPLFQERNII
jgi:hypothetical protein